ncbi:3'-5' exonuclease [Rubellimicrobium arenae]|uniref:3'-5' exonuclease n=1 Tax=Rubellimicrobium arenae TaxID=2817372 RepID=UPI001FED4B68|nr:3'-5' exonuclease [Rubellimicrobium arenae]
MNMRFGADLSAEDVLSRLLGAGPERTSLAPKDSRGIYGLVDHHGALRYVGSTASTTQTFYERIHQRHRTGSEDSSHYFSRMYNTGRMWRMRNDPATRADGDIAKALRNAFIAEYCRAVWVPLPDGADIAGLERAVIELAPAGAVAWNRRASEVYAEPQDLVDRIITRLGLGASELAALGRQKQRYEAASAGIARPTTTPSTHDRAMPPFPDGPFRFFALDVETANHDRGSICQIGVACVRPDNRIVPWVTYVDPQVDRWAFTYLHKIGPETVRGAPTFREVLPVLADALRGPVVYQHSGFDRSAIEAACQTCGRPAPEWEWKDSVQVARRAWPELRGNGGHGLASLKARLNLSFQHHDAGEDARAAAQVVLLAEAGRRIVVASGHGDSASDVLENFEETPNLSAGTSTVATNRSPTAKLIGRTTLTAGNIRNNHIYLRDFFDAFPKEVVGGSNAAATAPQTITVEWGGDSVVVTDLDGEKKFFRKRGWVREFFARTGAIPGDAVLVEMIGPYAYRVTVQRG